MKPKKIRIHFPARSVFIASALLFCQSLSAGEAPAFRDSSKPVEVRITDLISRLTIEQKAALLNHKGTTVTVDGYAIRADQWNQCLNGVQWNRPTTLFPACVALSATWNPDFVKNDVARVLSDEARAISAEERLGQALNTLNALTNE